MRQFVFWQRQGAPTSRHDSLANDRVQVEHAAAVPCGRIKVRLDRVVVLALGIQVSQLRLLTFSEKLEVVVLARESPGKTLSRSRRAIRPLT